ncbi:ATP-grasp domain-containing protein [Clostridium sp. AF19-22AC]|jgi:biotin carboxylase|uniref:ATP-grasp domain-containing protein n=1 Tax=Clostridia TaxID=186801 RepID=UPI000E4A65C4|nr:MULTISPECIES: ATP-grasp domain-containing protein [Clostridia]RHR31845.1 ATP-grasp domain-containing protein [Clostridium sp. AF19-22AC]
MGRIMIIAGGTWQVPLIRKAKSLGYEVVNSNLYEDSPGFKYSDFTEVCDVREKEKNLAIARKYNVSGVLTDQSDIAVPTVAYVAEKMKCPTIGCAMAELFTNKFKMREFCIENGFDSPEYQLCETVDKAVDFFNILNQKVVIKPLDSQSSRGVFTIENIKELKEKFPISQEFSNGSEMVLIERYISGKEFTIDGISFKGKHYSLAISEKSHFEYNRNIASELLFSYDNENYDYDQLRQIHNDLIEKTGLQFGLTHAEYKYENGKFYLIEMAARGGGTKIASDIVPYMSGIDTYKILIDSAMGNVSKENLDFTILEKYRKRWAVLRFLDIESNGKAITSIKGVDDIKNLEAVKDFSLEFTVGDIVARAQDDRSRVGYYIAYGESKDEINSVTEKVENLLKISFN